MIRYLRRIRPLILPPIGINLVALLLLSISLPTLAQFTEEGATPAMQRVAVVVFAQNEGAERAKRSAQSRIESILLDNGMTVLDQARADELQDVWKRLEDPGYFVTAEDFVANSEKFAIDGLVRVYLQTESLRTLANYHSATAQADIRLIDANAQVKAHTSPPMGAPGRPPSDGLTKIAAVVNAVQRAVDEAAANIGLEVIDLAKPRALKYALEGPLDSGIDGVSQRYQTDRTDFVDYAQLETKKWRNESVTCQAIDPSQQMGAVGGYIKDTDLRRHTRLYGSRLHLIDLKERRELTAYETSAVARKKKRKEPGTSKILDCLFLANWRYLAATTGNRLFLWDNERGLLMSSIKIEGGINKRARLDYFRQPEGDFLTLTAGGASPTVYQVVRAK